MTTATETSGGTAPGTGAVAGVVLATVGLLLGSAILAGSPSPEGRRLFLGLAAFALVIQWVAFVPSYLARTEHYYDLVGSLTYLGILGGVVAEACARGGLTLRGILVAGMVATWALRLGSFLFLRTRRAGGDARFAEIKRSAPRFLIAWTLQGLWVYWTSLAALILVAHGHPTPWSAWDLAGGLLWVAGFSFEVVADRQKAAFRSRPENRGRWIESGLWSWSRHPNYFGEIVLWAGIATIGAGVFEGAQWVGLVSPAFVALLLTRGSGVPLLEARAEARWGSDPAYRAYLRRTPRLVPWPPGPPPTATGSFP